MCVHHKVFSSITGTGRLHKGVKVDSVCNASGVRTPRRRASVRRQDAPEIAAGSVYAHAGGDVLRFVRAAEKGSCSSRNIQWVCAANMALVRMLAMRENSRDLDNMYICSTPIYNHIVYIMSNVCMYVCILYCLLHFVSSCFEYK